MILASGAASCTRSVIFVNWLAASGAERTLRAMPPTSLLCVMSWLRILMATGKPISSAALGALLGRVATIVLDGRDLVGLEHGLGLGLAEDRAAVAGDVEEDTFDRVAVGLEVREDVGRRLVEVREVARVLVHVHVGAHGVLGRVEGGHVGAAEDADALGHLDLAHERGEQRLELMGAGHVDERLGGGRGVAHRLRREDGEHAVAVGVVHERLRRGGVARRVGVAGHVDGVAARGEARQALLELLVGLGR